MAIYLRPETLASALEILARDIATAEVNDRLAIVAGATDFYPVGTTRQAWFQLSPQNILDITGINELRGIQQDDDNLRIGALATWSDIIAQPLPAAFDALKQAARAVGGQQIQNRGTIVGNICNASPAADGVPPLLALDAKVEISRQGTSRLLPLEVFVLGNRKTALQPGEMVSAIHIPARSAHEQSVFLKLGARAYLVISIASVATNVVLDKQGRIAKARIAVGACSAVPQRLHQLEKALVGHHASSTIAMVKPEYLAHLNPIDDVRASAEYRCEAAMTLVRRALTLHSHADVQAA